MRGDKVWSERHTFSLGDDDNLNISCAGTSLNVLTRRWAATVQDLVILDELLKKGYDRRATPTNHYNKSTPTSVYCELYMRSMSSPNPLTMDYKVDLYLIQRWKDERLKHHDLKQPLDLNDPNLVKAIWKPEVYFPNAKEADFQFVTVPNVLVRIHPDGEILYMLR
ncbi:unnamed protein product [Allacma fusca]|uniref:Neurotransmitter-gated ion-channel ligand-binding domain-containing protein n=1 Tax=Allacma fusca TaxID=39272 RepID=A0A8J2NWG8_9HEXA|nr:unnamed protein product [Allacma fusca]